MFVCITTQTAAGEKMPTKSPNVSRNIWCSINHRPVYSPLRDLHSQVKAKQFYNDGNLKGIVQVDVSGNKYVETPEKKKYHFYKDDLTDPNLTFIGYEEVSFLKCIDLTVFLLDFVECRRISKNWSGSHKTSVN